MDPAAPGANVGRRIDPQLARAAATRLERAVARFNSSESARTVAGLTRTLGEPQVSIGAAAGSPSDVRITIAWELCWYQWRVDVGNERGAVRQLGKGGELDQLDGPARQWNATATPEGKLTLGIVASDRARDGESVI